MTVQCPWCEYEGMVPSVEAHISGKRDSAHRGKVGHDLKEHLPQVGDGGETSTTSDESSFADLPEEGKETSNESDLADLPDIALDSPSETERGTTGSEDATQELPETEQETASLEEATQELPGSGGSADSSGWMLVVATALFCVGIVAMTTDLGSGSSDEIGEANEDEDEPVSDDVPLIGEVA